jgi:DNA-binding transcriptional regulator/RsmH inhibitor MraZ
MRERERERERQTNRQTNRKTDRQIVGRRKTVLWEQEGRFPVGEELRTRTKCKSKVLRVGSMCMAWMMSKSVNTGRCDATKMNGSLSVYR